MSRGVGDKVDGVTSARVPEPLSVRRNTLFNTVGSLAYQGCLWLTTVLVVLFSSSFEASGMLAYAMTVGTMFLIVATYSMRIFQVSDVEGVYSSSDYVSFRLLTTVMGGVMASVYTLFVAPSRASAVVTLLYLLFKADEGFSDVLYGIEQRGGRMDYIGVSQFVRGVLVVGEFAVVMRLTGDVATTVVGMFACGLAVTLLYDLPHARRFGPIRLALRRRTAVRLLRECLPLVVSTLAVTMVVSVARQHYASVYGVDRLGQYAAVATPAVLIQALARMLYSPALVPLAERWRDSPRVGFPRYFLMTVGLMLAFVLVMFVSLSVAGGPLLLLAYGERIAPYVHLFPYVLVSTGCIAMLWLLSDTLIVLRGFKGLLLANSGALVSTVVLMVPIEAALDMNGINVVVIISTSLGVVLAAFSIYRCIQGAKEQSHAV